MTTGFIELLNRLKNDDIFFQANEESVRQGMVLPVLACLGWNRDNIREVIPEYTVRNGRVDYCLKDEKTAIFLEVKKASEELEQHQKQLLEYAFHEGVPMAVLTNGFLWWFYLPLSKGSWEQRRFFAIDIRTQDIPAASEYFELFLSRKNVLNGTAIQKAEEIRTSREKESIIQKTIPRAWEELLTKPDELLLELLKEKVESLCGYLPEINILKKFLSEQLLAHQYPPIPSNPIRDLPPKPSTGNTWTNHKPTTMSFQGKIYSVRSFKEVLIILCKILYEKHRSSFFNLVSHLRGSRRPYFSRKQTDLFRPELIPGSDIYVETNLSAENIHKICNDLLDTFSYETNNLKVEIAIQ